MDEKAKKLLGLWLETSNPDQPYAHSDDLERFCIFVKYASQFKPHDVLQEAVKALEEKYGDRRRELFHEAEKYIYFYDTIKKIG